MSHHTKDCCFSCAKQATTGLYACVHGHGTEAGLAHHNAEHALQLLFLTASKCRPPWQRIIFCYAVTHSVTLAECLSTWNWPVLRLRTAFSNSA